MRYIFNIFILICIFTSSIFAQNNYFFEKYTIFNRPLFERKYINIKPFISENIIPSPITRHVDREREYEIVQNLDVAGRTFLGIGGGMFFVGLITGLAGTGNIKAAFALPSVDDIFGNTIGYEYNPNVSRAAMTFTYTGLSFAVIGSILLIIKAARENTYSVFNPIDGLDITPYAGANMEGGSDCGIFVNYKF